MSADILYFTKSNKNKINFAIEHFICLYNHILSALKMVSKKRSNITQSLTKFTVSLSLSCKDTVTWVIRHQVPRKTSLSLEENHTILTAQYIRQWRSSVRIWTQTKISRKWKWKYCTSNSHILHENEKESYYNARALCKNVPWTTDFLSGGDVLVRSTFFKVAKMCKSKKEVQLVFPVFSGNIL